MRLRPILIFGLLAFFCKSPKAATSYEDVEASIGALAYADATTLFQQSNFDEASEAFWKAIMKHAVGDPFTVSQQLQFMRSQ